MHKFVHDMVKAVFPLPPNTASWNCAETQINLMNLLTWQCCFCYLVSVALYLACAKPMFSVGHYNELLIINSISSCMATLLGLLMANLFGIFQKKYMKTKRLCDWYEHPKVTYEIPIRSVLLSGSILFAYNITFLYVFTYWIFDFSVLNRR